MTTIINPQLSEIHIHDITVSYQKHPAIHHLSVNLPLHQSIAIIGPNGAGKSTILKAIMGFLKVDLGKICLPFDFKRISYLPQQSEIDRTLPLSIKEMVVTGLYLKYGMFARIPKTEIEKVSFALQQVGLSGFEDRPLYSLSNGQFQRALFARIILQDADLIILDEPFNAVDAKTTVELCKLIEKWKQQTKTIISVIHDFHIAKTSFDYTLVIARELIGFGKTQEILNDVILSKAYSTLLHWADEAPECNLQQQINPEED